MSGTLLKLMVIGTTCKVLAFING